MPPPAVKVQGLKTLNRDLGKIDKDLRKETLAHFRTIGAQVAAAASADAPHRTGELAGSIKVASRNKGVAITSRLPQAGVLEYGGTIAPKGTRFHIAKRSFIGRPLVAHTRDLEEQVGDLLDRIAHSDGFPL